MGNKLIGVVGRRRLQLGEDGEEEDNRPSIYFRLHMFRSKGEVWGGR